MHKISTQVRVCIRPAPLCFLLDLTLNKCVCNITLKHPGAFLLVPLSDRCCDEGPSWSARLLCHRHLLFPFHLRQRWHNHLSGNDLLEDDQSENKSKAFRELIYLWKVWTQGLVVRGAISANLKLNFQKFYPCFFFFYSKAFSRIIFSFLYRFSYQHDQHRRPKRIKLNLPFKLSNLKSNFALTHLNPALNNSAHESFHKEVKYDRLQVCTLRLSHTDDPGKRGSE